MPLYIRDDEADELAEKVKTLAGAATKTEAVKIALRNEVARLRLKRRRPLSHGLDAAKVLARSAGLTDRVSSGTSSPTNCGTRRNATHTNVPRSRSTHATMCSCAARIRPKPRVSWWVTIQ